MSLSLSELQGIYKKALEVQKIHHGLSGRFFKNLKKEIAAKKQEKEIKIYPGFQELDQETQSKKVVAHAV